MSVWLRRKLLVDAVFGDVAVQALVGAVEDFDLVAVLVAVEHFNRRAVIDLLGDEARAAATDHALRPARALQLLEPLERILVGEDGDGGVAAVRDEFVTTSGERQCREQDNRSRKDR